MGRPSTYNAKIAARICERLAQGESLRAICRDEDMPDRSTVTKWVIDDIDGFASQYARARDVGLDVMADETLEIADTPQEGVKTKHTPQGVEKHHGDMIEHRRLRVDTRKWYLSKLAPKRYGDRLAVEHSGGVEVSSMTDDDLRAEIAALTAAVTARPLSSDDVSDLV